MAALLESTLSRKVASKKVVDWLKNVEHGDEHPFSESGVTAHKQEFVPFLLNFLREQSSKALTNGPATPAKTPTRPGSAAQTLGFSDLRGYKAATSGAAPRTASRVQLFSPATSVSPGLDRDASSQSPSHCLGGVSAFRSPSSSSTWSPASRLSGSEPRSGHRLSLGDYIVPPTDIQHSSNIQSRKGRKKGGASTSLGGQAKHVGGRGAHCMEEGVRWDTGGRKGTKGGGEGRGRINERVSPQPVTQLNLNNLDDFPLVGSSPVSPAGSKPSRRINPTPVSAERPHSKPKSCFTSTPLCIKHSSSSEESSGTLACSLSLQEERELLKQEKTKRAQQVGSPALSSMGPCTPTKETQRPGSTTSLESQTTCPELSKVTFSSELDILAELYCTCISENLVPNIFLELFFVMQLLTSWSAHSSKEEKKSLCAANSEVLERCYLRQVHNCVYFAVKVLENQFQLVAHLDKCTLRLLGENERVASFSPDLKERFLHAQDRSTAKISPSVPTFIHSVSFQPATDNRSNFGSDKAFHTFRKQRDIFYEALREWEDSHKEPGWSFHAALGGRIRGIMCQLTSAENHSHFARLFLKQLVQMCKDHRMNSSSGETPDADLLGMLGADSLGRLKRLEERLIQPHGVAGPCPPPSFPGHQEFFRDFLQIASCCQLNQHLQDSLCQQLLQLDEEFILTPTSSYIQENDEDEDGDMEQQDDKQRFSSVLLLARLLAKFLGFISFMPYQTSEKPFGEIQETAVALRSKSVPVLDVCAVLGNSIRRCRTVLTVPWLVEFLSMLDFIGPLLLCYRTALGMLLLLYRKMQLGSGAEMCYLNKLLMVSVLGWLFQIPVIPEDIFFTSEFTEAANMEDSHTHAIGLDCIPLVDQQLLYTCCPFLGEFRKLLAAFVSGSTAKSGGIIRKITPTSAELKDTPPVNRSQQKLQVDLEQAFFHNQPPSLRRTVEFVAERVGSNAVKHMKATLVSELVERGEKMLRDGLMLPNSNSSKLNDSICAQLCDSGLEALALATRFCNEKSPEAIRILLPEETSPTALSTAENITIHLAAEKACSWLSANITALIRREWKSRYQRVMKASPVASEHTDVDRPAALDLVAQERLTTPKRKQTAESETATSCPPHCTHDASWPSDVLVEMKEMLSIAVGPRCDEELPTCSQLTTLLQRMGRTLACKKFQTALSEQTLLNSSVVLAQKLVSGELPVVPPSGCSEHSGTAVGLGSGPEPPVTALLEQLADLWKEHRCPPAALHLLFTPLTVKAVLDASDKERNNYLFLIRKLVEKEALSLEEVISHSEMLTDLSLLPELIEIVRPPSHIIKSSPPLAELQSDLDVLEFSDMLLIRQ